MEYGTGLGLDWLGDIGALRQAVGALDDAGLDYVTFGGRIVTAREGRFENRPATTYAVPFREPFVLFANLAATTSRIKFRTGIVILPLYPTVLVAKQCAELSLISNGRFELGVGVSWHEPEYNAMGQGLKTRGRRLTEQVEVLRLLWTQPLVTFHGRFHDIDELGIGQLPDRSIPIWMGTGAEGPLLERIARYGDGWMPLFGIQGPEVIEAIQAAAKAAGRAEPIGIASRVAARPDELATSVEEAKALKDMGVTAIAIGAPPGSSISDGVKAIIATHKALKEELGD